MHQHTDAQFLNIWPEIDRQVFILGQIRRYRVISVEKSVCDVKIFRLEPVVLEPKDDKTGILSYTPCQFAFIHTIDQEGKSLDKRPYSIASAPSASYLEFAIEMRGGRFTSKLDKIGEGEIVGIEGPFGHIGYKNQPKAAFVAGGTGIAPFMSALRHIAEKKLTEEFVLFYSSRCADRILYGKELDQIRKANPNIRLVITLTRELPEGWEGESGRIDEAMIKRHIKNPTDYDWWLCGPLEMIKTIRTSLERAGTDPKKIRMEGWG